MPALNSCWRINSPFGQNPAMSQALWMCIIGARKLKMRIRVGSALAPAIGGCGHGSSNACQGFGAEYGAMAAMFGRLAP